MKTYRELEVWRMAMELCVEGYRLTEAFPTSEQFGLRLQVRRALVSVPSNIAEGWGRNSDPHFRNFLQIAKGSLSEAETQFEIADRLGYLAQHRPDAWKQGAAQLSVKLHNLMQKLVREERATYDSQQWPHEQLELEGH